MTGAASVVGLLVVASLMSCGAGEAHAEPDVWGTGKGLEMVFFSLGRFKAASELCGYHGMERWDAVVDAIDKRYEFCVTQDSRWSSLREQGDRKVCEAKGMNTSCGLASINVRINADGYIKRAQLAGVQAFCDGFPWKWVGESGPDNEKAKADYIKADPKGETSTELKLFAWLETLGRNPDWVTAPCDTSFW
jgi:hypothetical protein